MEMLKRLLLLVVVMSCSMTRAAPVKVIFDTDMDSDVDDAGAMAVLHYLADQDEVEILACVSSSAHPSSVPMIDVLNTYFGRPDIPVGRAVAGAPSHTWILEGATVSSEFPNDMTTANAEEAVALYRRILAVQPDTSVVIVTVGYLSNLEALLKSGADMHSTLAGSTLVARKVTKYVCMGSRYAPDTPLTGTSGNFRPDPDATDYVVNHWPTLIHFTGGGTFAWDAACGNSLKALPSSNPVRRCYELGPGKDGDWDHHVADLIAVYVAVRGYAPHMGLVTEGYNFIDDEGSNWWRTDYDNPLHQYTSSYVGDNGRIEVQRILDEMICYQPEDTAAPVDTAIVPDTLTGWWKLDDASGTTAADAGWYGQDGTGYGCTWSVGHTGGAVVLDGSDSYIDCGDPVSGYFDFGDNDNFSLCAWVRTSEVPDREYEIVAKYGGGAAPGYVLQILSNGHARFFLRDGSGSGNEEIVSVEGTAGLVDDAWHHVAGTVDRSGFLRLYVDGTEEGAAQPLSTLTGSLANSEPLYIGRRTSGDYFKGSIDDVRMYNYVLSASQVAGLADRASSMQVPAGMQAGTKTLNGGPVYYSCRGILLRNKPDTGVYIEYGNGYCEKHIVID